MTAFAAVLTGWRVGAAAARHDALPFDPAWHEPGRKTVLGPRLRAKAPTRCARVLADLARHPSTARFIATKLARHFVADDPPPALVDRLAARYRAAAVSWPRSTANCWRAPRPGPTHRRS